MSKLVEKAVLASAMVLLSAGSGMAIQWLGDTAGAAVAGARPQAEVQQKESPSLPAPGADIWIPGLGVVGKMPNLDFGLDMLYGGNGGSADSVPDRSDFEALDPDFSIKGTIRKKF